jgi:hypothetical protein
MDEAGLSVTVAEDITRYIEPTWAYCAQLVARPLVKWFLRFTAPSTRSFVRSFPLMSQAYAQGAMAFGLFVAKKPRASFDAVAVWRTRSAGGLRRRRLTEHQTSAIAPVTQARGSAAEVRKIIKEHCKLDICPTAVVVFVGERKVKEAWQTTDARVVAADRLLEYFDRRDQPSLTGAEIDLIAAHVDRCARN